MIKDKIINEMDKLSAGMQKKLLDYVIKLTFEDEGQSGKYLLKFAGLINKKDLREMNKIIEKDCEKIDYEGW